MNYPCSMSKVRLRNETKKEAKDSFSCIGELESVFKKIDGLLPNSHRSKFRDHVAQLRMLVDVSEHIGIHHKIVFHPLLV